MIYATQFHKEIRTGSSLPILVGGNDGADYVVKLKGGGEGVLANVVALLASRLGALLQIPILQPVCVNITQDFIEQAADPETHALLRQSLGINLATPYLPAAANWSARRANKFDKSLLQRIFLFDLFILNIDRTAENPNMIIHKDKLWCLDFASAMALRQLFTRDEFREYVLLKELKKHPFCANTIKPHGFIKDLRAIPDSEIQALPDELPDEWLGQLNLAQDLSQARKMLGLTLARFKNQGAFLTAKIDLLRVLRLETEAASAARMRKNREAFEKKHGKL